MGTATSIHLHDDIGNAVQVEIKNIRQAKNSGQSRRGLIGELAVSLIQQCVERPICRYVEDVRFSILIEICDREIGSPLCRERDRGSKPTARVLEPQQVVGEPITLVNTQYEVGFAVPVQINQARWPRRKDPVEGLLRDRLMKITVSVAPQDTHCG